MQISNKNLVLIGMPGSGKSTVGIILAKHISYDFIDTDVLIQVSSQRALQDIIDSDGYMALREIEEQALLDLSVHSHVVSTGGSAVYSEKGMAALKKEGVCVFLDVTLATLENRIGDYSSRGIAKRADQSLLDVFEERNVLYRRYADITVKCDSLSVDQVCDEIVRGVEGLS